MFIHRMTATPTEKPVQYVIVGTFDHGDWYFCDAESESEYNLRTWTRNVMNALRFDSEETAESIASLVCKDDEFVVEKLSSRYMHLNPTQNKKHS